MRAGAAGRSWGDVRVDAEQVRRIVNGLELTQTPVVLPERGAHLLGPIVLGQMVDVGAALQVRFQSAPERAHPGDVFRGLGTVRPLSYGIEVPLGTARRERGLGRQYPRPGPVHVEEDQGAERRSEARRVLDQD